MDGNVVRCRHCPATFKREDHRRRHEYTHAEPRYQCQFPDCGMRFHRTDVLKRHEEVHVPNPAKKRRRPRRGTDPKIRDSVSDGEVSEEEAGQSPTGTAGLPGLCQDCGRACTICRRCLNTLFDSQLPIECYKPLLFCVTHCVEFQMRRFAFIQHATVRVNWTRNGRLLAMAALGGLGIAEYKSATNVFFNAALRSFLTSPLTPEDPCPGQPLDGVSRTLLTSFQTRILLIEFGIWSQDRLSQTWAFEELMRMAARDAQKIVDMYNAVSAIPGKDHQTRLLEEEISRTAWTFYCLQVRVSVVFDMPLNVLQALKSVRLPGPEECFTPTAADEHDAPGENDPPSPTSAAAADTPFQHALFTLLSNQRRYHPTLARLSHFAQYILTHALAELYDAALAAPHNFPTAEAFARRHKPRLRVRDAFWCALDVWADHFGARSEELWARGEAASFARLQSNLLLDYLAVRMTDTDRRPDPECALALAAVERTVGMAESMAICGLLNIATKAHWMCDRASWWYACRMAKAQYLWAAEVGRSVDDTAATGEPARPSEGELSLLRRIAGVVDSLRIASAAEPLTPDSVETKLEGVGSRVEKMWTLVLRTEAWLD